MPARIAFMAIIIWLANLILVEPAETQSVAGVQTNATTVCTLGKNDTNPLVSARRGVKRGCVTENGRQGNIRITGRGTNAICTCVEKSGPALPQAADVSLYLQTEDPLPGHATFNLIPERPNFIKFFYLGLPLLEYTDGINGIGTVWIDVHDEEIKLTPKSVVFTSPSRKFFERIAHGNRTELVPGQQLDPVVFDRLTGRTVSQTTVRLKTVNWYYTEENPLISTARVGGSINLESGEYNLTLYLNF
jgi:hypothetical protein